MVDSDDVYDYGDHNPGPPTAKALAELDELVDRLIEAWPNGQANLSEDIASHMYTHGIRLRDFESRGRKVKVSVSTQKVVILPGQEDAAQAWLGGRKLNSAIRDALRKGSAIPTGLFDLDIRTAIRPAQA